MAYKRVLFVAPGDSGLDVLPEIDALYELGYQTQSLQGRVTRQRLFDAVRRQEFDVIHVAAHIGPAGVQLSDGELLDGPALVQVARSCKATLVFLNGCESAELGQMLVDDDVPAVICTLATAPDVVAKETAQTFYRLLVRHEDLRQAYHDSKPAALRGGYTFLSDGKLIEMQFGPIISRLDLLAQAQTQDAVEHADFRKLLADICIELGAFREIAGNLGRFKSSMIWVLVVGLTGSLAVQLLMTFIGRDLVR
jgi:hypothetical protein